MPNLATTLRAEIRKLAAKELKKALKPMRRIERQFKRVKLVAGGQKRRLATVERRLDRIRAGAVISRGGRRGRAGMSPEAVRALRDRFGMTREQFAKLLDVSPGSIFGWETGRTIPRGSNAVRLADAKKMGPREARAQVTGRGRAKTRAKARTRRRRTRRSRR